MLALILAAMLMQTTPAPAAPPDPCMAVGAAAAGAQNCPAWRSMLRADGNEIFVDPGSVRRSGDSFDIRERATLAQPLNGATSLVALYRFDCVRRAVTGIGASFYDPRGVRLRDYVPTGANAEPNVIPPGSPFDLLLVEFCPRQAPVSERNQR